MALYAPSIIFFLVHIVVGYSLLTTADTKQRYDSHKVLRVYFSDPSEYETFFSVVEKVNADVWRTNQTSADVMVAPEQTIAFSKFNYEVHIPDVQKLLDDSENEMRLKAVVGDVFSSFPTYGQVITWLDEQVALHPALAEKFVLGTSFSGVDILGLKLGTDSTKKVLYIHCTIHAREWITTTTCLWIIDSLLNTDPDGSALLSQFQWVIVPVLNVDGYNYAHTTNRLWRKNRQTAPSSTCLGTDLNRNYAYGWGGTGASPNPCADTYHGPTAFSAPETRSEQEYLSPLFDDAAVAAYVDIHSYGGQFMSPWGYTTALPPDFNEMNAAMRSVTDAIRRVNGRSYAYGSSARVIYIAAGGSDDQAYGNGGVIYSFTVEAYGTSFTPSVDFIKPVGSELYAGVKQLANYINSK